MEQSARAEDTAKLTHNPGYVREWGRLGFATEILTGVGLVQLTCLIVYLIPSTSVLGAVLLTGRRKRNPTARRPLRVTREVPPGLEFREPDQTIATFGDPPRDIAICIFAARCVKNACFVALRDDKPARGMRRELS